MLDAKIKQFTTSDYFHKTHLSEWTISLKEESN